MEKTITELRIEAGSKKSNRNTSEIAPYKVDVLSIYDSKSLKAIQKDLKKTFKSGNEMLLSVTLAQPMTFDELESLNVVFSGKDKSASRVNGFINASKTDDGIAHARKGYNTRCERVSDEKGTVTTYVTSKA